MDKEKQKHNLSRREFLIFGGSFLSLAGTFDYISTSRQITSDARKEFPHPSKEERDRAEKVVFEQKSKIIDLALKKDYGEIPTIIEGENFKAANRALTEYDANQNRIADRIEKLKQERLGTLYASEINRGNLDFIALCGGAIAASIGIFHYLKEVRKREQR